MGNRGVLLISCPDKPGIVAAVTSFLFEQGANIICSDQYSTDPSNGMFFMRIEFEIEQIQEKKEQLFDRFSSLAERFNMDWQISFPSQKKRVAIFVSKEDHALVELLWHWRSGDLNCDIAMIISNHEKLRHEAESMGLPFHYIPVDRNHKQEAERRQLDLLRGKVDLIILAKYMQILSPEFIADYKNKIINIHHSFLPAFIGARPYERAYERGVKIIGATAHYVNAELDAGPIIEQDIIRVTHHYDATELKKEGRLVERAVLARAVKWHLEDRIVVHGNKTVVFN